MHLKKILIFLLLLPVLVNAQRRLDLSNYKLVWSDEFSYTGTQDNIRYQMLDAPNAKWYIGDGFNSLLGGYLNGVPQIGFRRENISVYDGYLHLDAKREDTSFTIIENSQTYDLYRSAISITSLYDNDYDCTLYDPSWTGAYVVGGFNFGIFEIRAKLPRNRGDYSAFWFWNGYGQCGNLTNEDSCPSPVNNIPCPYTSCPGFELDVFETNQQDSFKYFSTNQPNGILPQTQSLACHGCATFYDWVSSDPSTTFHTYTLAWTPNSVTWFIDGNEIRTQTESVPKVKLKAILSCGTWGAISQPFVVDYIRLYRPSSYFDAMATNTSKTDYIWTDFDDPARLDYINSYDTTHLSNDNYRFIPTETSTLGRITPNATATILNTSGGNTLYYTNNNNLYNVYFQPYYNGNNSSFIISPSLATNVATDSKLSIEPSTGNIFWKTINNKLMVRWQNGNIWTNSSLDNIGQYPNDIGSNILCVSGNNLHPTRVYYTSTNTNTLCYYEWCQSTSQWYRHATLINGVMELIEAPNSIGKLFYKRNDNHIWSIPIYTSVNASCNSNQPNGWQITPIDNNYLSIYADCGGDLTFSPNGTILYYRTINNELAYWNLATGQRIITPVIDVKGKIKVKENSDGNTEIFYISTNDKVKTYYQRKAPSIANEKQWQNSTLDVFSQVFNNGGQLYSVSAYNVQNMLEVSEGYPTYVYCFTNTGEIGAYKKTANWVSIPHVPYTECQLPVGGWHNGYEGREIDDTPSANHILENKNSPSLANTSNIQIYPNPTNAELNIILTNDLCNSTIQILNAIGQTVKEVKYECGNQEIDIQDIENGLYFLRVIKDNHPTQVSNFIKQ